MQLGSPPSNSSSSTELSPQIGVVLLDLLQKCGIDRSCLGDRSHGIHPPARPESIVEATKTTAAAAITVRAVQNSHGNPSEIASLLRRAMRLAENCHCLKGTSFRRSRVNARCRPVARRTHVCRTLALRCDCAQKSESKTVEGSVTWRLRSSAYHFDRPRANFFAINCFTLMPGKTFPGRRPECWQRS